MTTQKLKVLVYGATGSQSSPVVWKLLERGHHPYLLTRYPDRAVAMREAGAQIVMGDMADAASLRAASAGMDAVALLVPFFLPNPSDGATYGRNAIAAAKAAGVKLVVWNASGLIPEKKTGNPAIDMRIEVRDYLQASGIPNIIIQPIIYMENLLGPWTAPAVAAEDRLPYPHEAHLEVGWIASDDVGALTVAALERPELANANFTVSGLEVVNGIELASRFTEALDRKISYVALEPEEFGAILDSVFGPGAGASAAREYQKMRENPQRPAMHVDMRPILEALPIRMTTLKEWVSKQAAAFTKEKESKYSLISA